MRPIRTIDNEKQALAFGDYLVTLSIANQVDRSKDGWIVWVVDEEEVARAGEEFRKFQANPSDPKYDRAAAADQIRRDAEREDAERAGNITSPRQEWFEETKTLAGGVRRLPLGKSLVTLALIGACIGVAIATSAGDKRDGEVMNALYISPIQFAGDHIEWDDLTAVRQGQVWRLISPILLHFGLFHLIFNMWWLRDFGMMIEPAKGPLKFAGLVVAVAAVSNLAQYLADGPYGGGMSGVIYGLFGYIWMRHKFAPWEGLAVSKSTIVLLIFWLFWCMAGMAGPVGNTAHATGLVTGIAIGYAPVLRQKLRRKA